MWHNVTHTLLSSSLHCDQFWEPAALPRPLNTQITNNTIREIRLRCHKRYMQLPPLSRVPSTGGSWTHNRLIYCICFCLSSARICRALAGQLARHTMIDDHEIQIYALHFTSVWRHQLNYDITLLMGRPTCFTQICGFCILANSITTSQQIPTSLQPCLHLTGQMSCSPLNLVTCKMHQGTE